MKEELLCKGKGRKDRYKVINRCGRSKERRMMEAGMSKRKKIVCTSWFNTEQKERKIRKRAENYTIESKG